jgi:hypothetical protein
MLPVSRQLLLDEIRSAKAILERWEKIVDPDNTDSLMPVLDVQAPREHLAECLIEMQAELVIAAGKCENLAESIHNRMR